MLFVAIAETPSYALLSPPFSLARVRCFSGTSVFSQQADFPGTSLPPGLGSLSDPEFTNEVSILLHFLSLSPCVHPPARMVTRIVTRIVTLFPLANKRDIDGLLGRCPLALCAFNRIASPSTDPLPPSFFSQSRVLPA